jgi:hypothetical protein
VVIWSALTACTTRTPTERERALEWIPSQAHVIATADGPALATPTFRKVLDAARPSMPPSLSCVLEAATTSQSVAVALEPNSGATIVLVTRAVVADCPALSKLADRVYAATIGAGALAKDRASSMLVDATWDRARPYLTREPFAFAAELPTLRAIAVAQPEPVDAWLAVDAVDPVATEKAIKAALARYTAPPTIELAGKLTVARAGTQVTVNADKLGADELATLALDLIEHAEQPPAPPAIPFVCPPADTTTVSCHDGTHLRVRSVPDLLAELGAVASEPVVAGGDIIGVRLTGDPPHVLRRDDVILGVGANRITSQTQLADLARTIGNRAAIAVRREGVEVVLDLTE